MLPDRYNRLGVDRPLRFVSYIESTGTQYINTGVAPDFAGGDEIEIKYTLGAYTGYAPCVFGSRASGVRNGVYVLAASGTVADGDGTYSFIVPNSGTVTMRINDSTITANGNATVMPRRVTTALPMFLFALNNYGTGTYGIYNGLRISDWKYYHNGELAQHLVPALLQGVPGMWDMVSRTFLTNAGTGTFNYA